MVTFDQQIKSIHFTLTLTNPKLLNDSVYPVPHPSI